jgi:hypothetical protein
MLVLAVIGLALGRAYVRREQAAAVPAPPAKA